MESKILSDIRQQGEITVDSIAQQYDMSRSRPTEEYSSPLLEMCHILLLSLAATGVQMFDDEAQWHTYQNILAALHLANQELAGEPSRLPLEYEVPRPATNDYNPLGELDELKEPTIARLADRYQTENTIDENWEENPSLNLQEHLGAALLEVGDTHFPESGRVQLNLLAAMLCVDEHYGTETILEVSVKTVTETFPELDDEEIEFETPVMTFKQREKTAPKKSNV